MLGSKSLRKYMASVSQVALLTTGSEATDEATSWKHLLYTFSQNTTFHGVRYITADTQFVLRRIIWLLLVLGASSFFIWFMTDRLMYLTGHPKAVDVEVIFTDSVLFPAVTICNQNLFRTSATHRLGLHDVVEESFEKLKNSDSSNKNEDGFDKYEDHYLSGMGVPHAVYLNVTSVVCRYACVHLHSDSCCSVVFERSSRRCLITPLDHNSTDTRLVPRPHTAYYKRRKCSVQQEANCTFEGGLCSFTQDFSRTVPWRRVPEDGKTIDIPEDLLPIFDHTTMTAEGGYMLAATKFHQPNAEAHLISPYILAGHDTCIRFYYQLRGGVLNIRVRHQAGGLDTVWSRSRRTRDASVGQWEAAYHRLLPGYYRLVVEAKAGTAAESMNVAVDDLDIGPCGLKDECKETDSGAGYSGDLAHSASGRACYIWNNLDSYVRDHLWKSHDLAVMADALPSMSKFCRNPDDDRRGPWCFTNHVTDQMEYCDIPRCVAF